MEAVGALTAWFLSFVAVVGFALVMGIRDWWQDGTWSGPLKWLGQTLGLFFLLWLFAVCTAASAHH